MDDGLTRGGREELRRLRRRIVSFGGAGTVLPVGQHVDEHLQDEVALFVCECGNADCIGALMVTVDEYEIAQSAPDRFIVRAKRVMGNT